MTYLLDTNTLIYFFKGFENVRKSLLSKPPSEIAIPSIVLFELEFGVIRSNNPQKRRKQLEQLLSAIKIIPFTQKESRQAAKLKAHLATTGMLIGPMDILIAGTALANNSVLVTHNKKEFSRVPDLKIEDWF
jgi:tRNA(fMet)-specific endonuclease VapC